MSDYFGEGVVGKRRRFEILRAELKLDRSSFEPGWRDQADFILPRRARFTLSDTNRGERRNQKILDSTGTFAARTLRSGMMSGITSPARPWFRLTTPDPDLAEFAPVKTWLDDVRERMVAEMLKSNLYKALPTLYGDTGVFGTGAMAVLEDDDAAFRCMPFAIGEYYLANDQHDRTRTFMREFRLTLRQLLGKFGRKDASGRISDWSNFSTYVRQLYATSRFGEWIDVVHVVQENPDFRPNALASKHKPYLSCYYEIGSSTTAGNVNAGYSDVLEEKGFDEFPILAGRWETGAGDAYGTECPGNLAIPDIKQLQFGTKTGAQILDKINRPPMVAHTDLRGNKLTQLPGDVSYVEDDTGKRFRPAYDVSSFRFDYHEASQQQIRTRIDKAFFVDLFLLMSQTERKNITATEIIERKEEKLLALGPMLENLNQDVLDPLIDRVFAIMDRRDMLPSAPKELEGTTLHVDYVSVMAQAQKAIGRSGLQGFISFVGELATAKQDPSVWDKADTDQIIDEAGDLYGVPAKIIVPDEKVAAVRQARAKAAQAAQQAATIKDAAQGAKTLSEADTGGKNALTDILGQLGAPAGGAAAALPS